MFQMMFLYDLPMKHGDFPVEIMISPIKTGDYPCKNRDY